MSIRYRKSRGSERKPRLWLVCLVVLAVLCAPFVAATMGDGSAGAQQQDHAIEQRHERATSDDPADLASPGTSGADRSAGDAAQSPDTTVESPGSPSRETGAGAIATEDTEFAKRVGNDSALSTTGLEHGSATIATGTATGTDPEHDQPVETDSRDGDDPAGSTEATASGGSGAGTTGGGGDGGGAGGSDGGTPGGEDGAEGARGDGGGTEGDRSDERSREPLDRPDSTGGGSSTTAAYSLAEADTVEGPAAPVTTVADVATPAGVSTRTTAGDGAPRPPFEVEIAVAGMILLGLAVAFRLARE